MGLDFIKLQKKQQSERTHEEKEKEKENMSLLSKILNYIRGYPLNPNYV
jgi:hypothetical protein